MSDKPKVELLDIADPATLPKLLAAVAQDHYVSGFNRRIGAGVSMRANESVYQAHESQWEKDALIGRVAVHVQAMLKELFIDVVNDHNTAGTAHRVAKMYVTEIMRGRFTPPPDITAFPNKLNLDELYTTGPITVRSLCSHHLAPIMGKAWIGVIPGEDSVIGLSKFNRLVDWIFARPQIQEEATIQLADAIMAAAKPKGLAVVVKAQHLCMTWRGVRENPDAVMTTSVMRGALMDNPAARAEFFSLIKE